MPSLKSRRVSTSVLLTPLVALLMQASSARAFPVVADVFVPPGETAEYIFIDLNDDFQTISLADGDLDGVVQFNYDTDTALATGHHMPDCLIIDNIGSGGFSQAVEGVVFPMFRTDTGVPLMTVPLTTPSAAFPTFTIGQTVQVVDGMISAVPELSIRQEGGMSAEDLLRADATTLPTYSGDAVVGAMVSYHFPAEVPGVTPWAIWLIPLSLIAFALRRPEGLVRVG